MGLGELLGNVISGKGNASNRKSQIQNCPNCGETVNLSMERCPKCGVMISSMFRRKCPKCNTLNELENPKCLNCRYEFDAKLERAKKTYYVCPICRHQTEVLFTKCPVCGTRFM